MMKNTVFLHWLSILLENREFEVSSALAAEAKEYILKKFKIEYEEYDAIVGYRADDSLLFPLLKISLMGLFPIGS